MIYINILIITTCYPPVNVSGSIRSLYYANYMAKLGHKVSVLTVDFPNQFSNYDKSLENRIDESIKVYRCGLGILYNKFYQKKEENINRTAQINQKSKENIKSKLRREIKSYLAIPDSYMVWKNSASKLGIDIIKSDKIDLIFSMHETPSSHLVAYNLKQKFQNVRWVAYWSDPWTFDPNRSEIPYIRKQIEKIMEKKVVKLAEKHFFTTKECMKLYREKFIIDKNNADIVYRGYDDNLYKHINSDDMPKEINKDKINILHAGEIFTKLRDINPFIRAIRDIKHNNIELYKKLNIILLGGIDNIDNVEKFDDLDIINLLPRKSFDEALKYMNFSDVLLLFGNKNSNQMPGKVYDYLGTDKAIFTILGDQQDPLKLFMKEIERGPICENRSNELKSEIINILSRGFKKEWTCRSNKFEWTNVVQDLLSKLENI